jgi:hypothetical protein
MPVGQLRLYIRGYLADDAKAKPTLELTFWNQQAGAQHVK